MRIQGRGWRCRMKWKKSAILLMLIILCSGSIFAQRSMSVTVKEVEVRSSPSFLGAVVSKLEYGDRVRVKKEQGSWAEIQIPDSIKTGWVHMSALERRRIVFGASNKDIEVEATSSEIALAGKGFNKEVEELYISETNLDFTRIDRMESVTVSTEIIAEFLTTGGLNTLER